MSSIALSGRTVVAQIIWCSGCTNHLETQGGIALPFQGAVVAQIIWRSGCTNHLETQGGIALPFQGAILVL